MEDGELDFSNKMHHQLLAMDSFLDDFLGDSHAYTQTYTSNQTEQDAPYSQSNFHHRSKNLPAEEKTTTEETDNSVEIKSKKKRAPGNRESVRKYRERKKARQALIEEELNQLRVVNQQLLKRLQGQVALEKEVSRFKCLLVDIRGRIKGELGSFPYQMPTKGKCGGISRNMSAASTSAGAYDVNDLQYHGLDNQDVDVSGGLQNEGFGASDGSHLPCVWNNSSAYNEFLEFGQTNVRFTGVNNPSTTAKKRKGKISNKNLNR
ncbi:hypothetical protein MKW92_046930 [Papaver armeniacum]|nr:hypothetical protein MKW92_046930 [Papaver armeniacum]